MFASSFSHILSSILLNIVEAYNYNIIYYIEIIVEAFVGQFISLSLYGKVREIFLYGNGRYRRSGNSLTIPYGKFSVLWPH
jgi:hypothetical protein